ncbi:MAG: heterodisulfide reductase subunit B, partial [Proteobacteria bacterium]|nr:heterodisulfide reductase subunit B [Pseudomonadota bacterium]
VECCGASFGIPRKDVVMRLSGKLLDTAKEMGAMALVTACPLCQMNLDMRQEQINSANGSKHHMPIFYFTQLMGLAFGLTEKELGIDKLCVNPRTVIDALGMEGNSKEKSQ